MTRNPLNKLTQYENPEDDSKLRPISHSCGLSNRIVKFYNKTMASPQRPCVARN